MSSSPNQGFSNFQTRTDRCVVLGWLATKTTMPARDYARDERGALRLSHASDDLRMPLADVFRAWSALEDEGRVLRNLRGQLCLVVGSR